jgi:Cytochrome c554 and c-prime
MNGNPQPTERADVERVRQGARALLAASLGLAAGLFGCAPDGVRVSPVAAVVPARVLMPGPAPRGRDVLTASALNATCTGCHPQIAAEWRASFHARAERDDAYQRALALEPLPFCRGCHAPEANAFQRAPEVAAELGVACVTCHVTGEHVLAAAHASSALLETSRADAPHALTRSPEFAGAGACATCHEFSFPDAALRAEPELMQATASEHRHSEARAVPCATCHMPSVGEGAARHRSHAFPGGHDADLVKSAIRVRAQRCGTNRVCLVLAAKGVGHAFPTGDLFRRLEVSAEAVGDDYQVVGSSRRYLARHWSEEQKLATLLRRVTRDDRATDAPVELQLTIEGPVAALPIAWRVAYQRVDHPRSEVDEDSVVAGEIEVASGTVLPLSKGENSHAEP